MRPVGRALNGAWRWLAEDAATGSYDALRVAVGLGGGLLLTTWVNGSAPGSMLGTHPANTLEPGSAAWWTTLAIGLWCSGSLILGRLPRAAAAGLFLALQLCGGYMVNWAGLAVQFSAALLVFASGRRVPVWPRRVLQLQLPLGYAVAVTSKLLLSEKWRGLEAFSTLTEHPMNRFAWPTVPGRVAPVFDVLGLLLEGGAAVALLVAVLTSNRKWLTAGLACSILLHVGISLFVPVGLFLVAMLPFWLAHGDRVRVPQWVRYTAIMVVLATMIASGVISQNPFTVIG